MAGNNQPRKKGKSGTHKYGREVNKKARKGSPLSLYVRDKISAEAYFKMTGRK